MRSADPAWRRLLDHLAMAGPSLIDDLRVELDLKRQELKALRYPLERCGAIVARSVATASAGGAAEDGSHSHPTELSLWDQAYSGDHAAATADPVTALGDLLVAAVQAAVVAPEAELRRWFSWQWYWTDTPDRRRGPLRPPPPRRRLRRGTLDLQTFPALT